MTDKSETKDAKTAQGWDGEADPTPRDGGSWFWGGDPPVLDEPQARDAKAVSKSDKPT